MPSGVIPFDAVSPYSVGMVRYSKTSRYVPILGRAVVWWSFHLACCMKCIQPLAAVIYVIVDKLPYYPQYCGLPLWRSYTDVGVCRPLFKYTFVVYSEDSA